MPKAVALYSGGLDSSIAVCLVKDQGIEVEGFTMTTPFCCCGDAARIGAERLDMPLRVHTVGDEYYDILYNPRYGFGKGANPCVDCRIYMLKLAAEMMREIGAEFVFTGEVLGQRPMSQQIHHLDIVAKHSGLGDRLFRPLSAKFLPETYAETSGLIDREKLPAIQGRSRREIMELSERYGFGEAPSPSAGCTITERSFAPRVFDLIENNDTAGNWEFSLLRVGRHVRIDRQTKASIGRNEEQNGRLAEFFEANDAPDCALVEPKDFTGPAVLVVGPIDEKAVAAGGALVLRFGRPQTCETDQPTCKVRHKDQTWTIHPELTEEIAELKKL